MKAYRGGRFVRIESGKATIVDADLRDYKFFCFNGEPKFIYVSNSLTHEIAFFDLSWNLLPYKRSDYVPFAEIPEKPSNLDEMIECCKKLSKDIPHVRVDLYNVKEKVYFGELTFYTASGFIPFTERNFDEEIGKYLTLKGVNGGGSYTY